MPIPSPAGRAPRLSRRSLLAGVATVTALPLVGCTADGTDRDRPGPVEPEVDPDVAIATDALAAQQATIALVVATQERHPRLADRLAPLLTAHRAHADLLARAVPRNATPDPDADPDAEPAPDSDGEPSAPTTTSVPPSPSSVPTVPGGPQRALRALVVAERELVTVTKQHAFKARSGAFARVLGSIAAAAAQHAAVLGEPGSPA